MAAVARALGRPVHILSPGPIEQTTGGYIFLRRIAEGLERLGEAVVVHPLSGPHPVGGEESRRLAEQAVDTIPDGALVLADGLALPVAAPALWRDRTRLRLTALVHHPLHLETGLDAGTALLLHRVERDALSILRHVLVPSRATARDVEALGVPASRVTVTTPGTEPAHRAAGSDGADGPLLLTVGILTPRKGHLTLLDALARLTDLPWRLALAGSAERDPAYAQAVRDAVTAHGLDDRVDMLGEIPTDDLEALRHRADLCVVPSQHEGYGMVAAEALARGLPVVATTAGSLAELVPPQAGALVPPGDAEALATALRPLLADPARRARAADAAWDAGQALPDWDRSIAAIRAALAGAAA